MNMQLSGMSSTELLELAAAAKALAADLKQRQPSYALALANGVRDISYNTVRYGFIRSYSGEAVITMDDGTQWRAVGHRPKGGAEWVSREGYIEFIPLS